MKTYFYNWPTEADAAADGAMTLDAETQTYQPASGWTRTPGPVWLTAPVMSEPDPETGEQTVVTPGVQSEPVVLLRPTPLVALADHEIEPAGHGGFA
jgi:hypothetical protein